MRFFYFVIFLCLSLNSYQPVHGEKILMKNKEVINDLDKKEDSLFTVNISVPKKVMTNELFTVIGNFEAKSNQKLQISSREKLFSFVIKDLKGRQINSSVTTDAGKIREISGKALISEKFNYKIKEPGLYEISAVVEFTLTKGDKEQSYTKKTNVQIIEVVNEQ